MSQNTIQEIKAAEQTAENMVKLAEKKAAEHYQKEVEALENTHANLEHNLGTEMQAIVDDARQTIQKIKTTSDRELEKDLQALAQAKTKISQAVTAVVKKIKK